MQNSEEGNPGFAVRMKALQKNQGRTDQMLGAMADVLTSVALPTQQWVSCLSVCISVCLSAGFLPVKLSHGPLERSGCASQETDGRRCRNLGCLRGAGSRSSAD